MASEVFSARENTANPINVVSKSSRRDSIDKIEFPKRAGREKEYNINGNRVVVSASTNRTPFGSTSAYVNVKIGNGREQSYKFGWDYSKGYGANARHISRDEAISKAKAYIKKKTS